jgi:hypothetical protein
MVRFAIETLCNLYVEPKCRQEFDKHTLSQTLVELIDTYILDLFKEDAGYVEYLLKCLFYDD